MYGLPEKTVLKKQLSKAAVYRRFDIRGDVRARFDDDISRMHIVGAVNCSNIPSLGKGKKVTQLYVIRVELKDKDFNEADIRLLDRLIGQNMVFVLVGPDGARLAVVQKNLFVGRLIPEVDIRIPIVGTDLDMVWNNIVADIASLDVSSSESLDDQIVRREELGKLDRKIESLEKKERRERQRRKKYELHKEIVALRRKRKLLV